MRRAVPPQETGAVAAVCVRQIPVQNPFESVGRDRKGRLTAGLFHGLELEGPFGLRRQEGGEFFFEALAEETFEVFFSVSAS